MLREFFNDIFEILALIVDGDVHTALVASVHDDGKFSKFDSQQHLLCPQGPGVDDGLL